MFYLRRITGSGVEMNQTLGEGYTLVDKLSNEEEFNRSFLAHFGEKQTNDLVYAFIGGDGFIQPLYKAQKAYVMTERGNTFANVSYKE